MNGAEEWMIISSQKKYEEIVDGFSFLNSGFFSGRASILESQKLKFLGKDASHHVIGRSLWQIYDRNYNKKRTLLDPIEEGLLEQFSAMEGYYLQFELACTQGFCCAGACINQGFWNYTIELVMCSVDPCDVSRARVKKPVVWRLVSGIETWDNLPTNEEISTFLKLLVRQIIHDTQGNEGYYQFVYGVYDEGKMLKYTFFSNQQGYFYQ